MKRKVSKRLYELRTEAKLSYAALSKATGISKSALCRWEKEQADIASEYIIILAKFFNVSTDYLLGLED